MTYLAYLSLWVFAFTLPWERLVSLPGLYIVSRATGAMALGLTMFAIVISGRVRRWTIFHTAAMLFVVWTGIGIWLLGMPAIPQKYYTFVQLFAVLWMIWELAPTAERVRGLLSAFVLGAFVPALATIMLFVRSGGSLRRFSAGGADPNSLAMTLALTMPMAWYLSLTTDRPLFRWICRAYVPIGLLATALTGSRGGILAWLVGLTIIPFTMKLSPGRLAAVLVMLAVSGGLLVAYVPDTVMQRLGTTGESLQSSLQGGGMGGRLRFWIAGIHAFFYKPLMGYGVGSFVRAITPELGSQALVAHNSFISVLVEEGLVGLILYLTMFFSVLRAVLRFPSFERRFGLVLYATLGTAMLPLTWEDQKSAWFVMAILVAMSVVRMTARREPARARPVAVGRVAPGPRRMAQPTTLRRGLDSDPAA
jgi:O-antigen ligase